MIDTKFNLKIVGALDSKDWNYISLYLASWLKEAKMGAVMYSGSKTQV